MSTLGLPNSTYYRYKSKIYKESKKIWNDICTKSLEHRALALKKKLELSVKVNEKNSYITSKNIILEFLHRIHTSFKFQIIC